MVSFQTQNSNLGKKIQGLRLENVDIFYGNSEYFIDIWDILSLFCVHLVHFFSFGIMHQEKSGNPGSLPKHFVTLKSEYQNRRRMY
jgi:hypothetical protein